MKTKLFFLFITSVALYSLHAESPHVIICTFKPYPELPEIEHETSKNPLKQSFHEATNAHLKTHWIMEPKSVQGFAGTYWGYTDESSPTGTMIFPRKHKDDSFLVVITPKLAPVFMIENTIDTWQIPQDSPYKSYMISRKQDKATNLYFWDVQEIEQLSEDRLLPINALTIFADPASLYIPTGISVTSTSPQLLLPPFYVRKKSNPSKCALNLLDIRCFFEPVSRALKVSGATMQAKMGTLS